MTRRPHESRGQQILEKGATPTADVRLLREAPHGIARDAGTVLWAEQLAPACYLDVGNVCNQHCLYCAVPRQTAYRATCGEVERVAIGAVRHGFDVAALIGGEPTIWPHLLPTLHALRSAGVARFILATNGLMLAYPETLDRLVAAGVSCVGLSIDDFDPGIQARLTRHQANPGLVEKALENLARRADVQTYLYTVLTGALNGRMDAHVARCRELASRFARPPAFIFAGLKPVATALENWPELAVTLTGTASLASSAVAGLKEVATVAFRDLPLCLPGLDLAHSLDCYHEQAAIDLESGQRRPAPLAHDRTFVTQCQMCRYKAWCPAIYQDYVARYGDEEFRAIG
jgi:MoaA/NifB/PqqE/SkfB family radical SAM enzyme